MTKKQNRHVYYRNMIKRCYARRLCRILSIAALMMLYVHILVAQQRTIPKLAKSFQGTWQLKEVGENGKNDLRKSPFHQYKYYGEDCFMMMTFWENKEKAADMGGNTLQFSIKWGDLSFAPDDMILEGYDTIRLDKKGRKRFSLKWMNRLPNYRLYPVGTVVEEIWKKGGYSEEGNLIVKAIAMKGKVKNRFIGLWRREKVYVYMNTDKKIGTMVPATDNTAYKIYGDKVSLFITKMDFDSSLKSNHIIGEMRPQKYVSSNAMEENGVQCLVGWEGENTFRLTYFDEQRMPYIEVWTRVMMPTHILDMIREAR